MRHILYEYFVNFLDITDIYSTIRGFKIKNGLKILIISLILLSLVSVGTAFAGDVNDTDITQISEIEDDSITIGNQTNDLSTDGTYNDLNTLIQNASSGDTILLEGTIYLIQLLMLIIQWVL